VLAPLMVGRFDSKYMLNTRRNSRILSKRLELDSTPGIEEFSGKDTSENKKFISEYDISILMQETLING
jgi:hypothetical protein